MLADGSEAPRRTGNKDMIKTHTRTFAQSFKPSMRRTLSMRELLVLTGCESGRANIYSLFGAGSIT